MTVRDPHWCRIPERLRPRVIQFGANQGLHVSNVLADTGNYSIDLVFRLDDTSGFRKLIDFADRSVDTGLYVHNGSLEFYNKPSLPTVTIAPSQLNTILLTRDAATKIVSGYVNGLQQFAFSDTTNIAVFSGTNGIMRFFEDDTATGGSEASGGFVDRIRIADNAQGQFGSAAATPLPTAGIAGLTLLGGLGLTRGRRQSAPTHR